MKKKVRERLARIEDALQVLIAEVEKLQPSSHRHPDGTSNRGKQSASKALVNASSKTSRTRSRGRLQGTVARERSDEQ